MPLSNTISHRPCHVLRHYGMLECNPNAAYETGAESKQNAPSTDNTLPWISRCWPSLHAVSSPSAILHFEQLDKSVDMVFVKVGRLCLEALAEKLQLPSDTTQKHQLKSINLLRSQYLVLYWLNNFICYLLLRCAVAGIEFSVISRINVWRCLDFSIK